MSIKMTDPLATPSDTNGLLDIVDLYVDVVSDEWGDGAVLAQQVEACVLAVLTARSEAHVPIELSVRLTNDEDIQQLNSDFRNKDKPTNVLSFAAFGPDELEEAYGLARAGGPPVMLGDIVMTYGVTSREASEQGKVFSDHFAHLVVHGFLHLLGFDHIKDNDAEKMESLEKEILASLGIEDPYKEGGEGVR